MDPSTIPDSWDMELDPVNNSQNKRKGDDSPATDYRGKKRALKIPKVPTASDTDVALNNATKATEYACHLVEGLADEFVTEDHIGPALSKVAKALANVCKALSLLTAERSDTTAAQKHMKTDASTNTENGLPPVSKLDTRLKTQDHSTATPVTRNEQELKSSKAKQLSKKKKKGKLDNRTPTSNIPTQQMSSPTIERPTPLETEPTEEPFVLVERKTKNASAPKTQPARKTHLRPAAVLVKVSDGRTYADTLRAVRATEIDFEAMGTHVTSMRKTIKGDLLVELTKGTKAVAATSKIRDRIAEAITGSIVTRLRHSAEVEITDLDEVTTKEEVLDAIRKAINGKEPLSDEEIKVTGLWATRDGRQMATASVPISVSRSLTTIRVGWTQCRVRPRRPEPARCYRCHGFGHPTRQCTGPDLSLACRRCGLNGHTQAICTEPDDHCVACDRIKAPRVPHKPGSGACAARRKAIADMRDSPTRK